MNRYKRDRRRHRETESDGNTEIFISRLRK